MHLIAAANPSDLATAVIAIGASITGGLVAGSFALAATRRQHAHDLEMQRQEHAHELAMQGQRRSHDAARNLHESIVVFSRCLAEWAAEPSDVAKAVVAGDGYNAYVSRLATESTELRDRELRDRLEVHMLLSHSVLNAVAAQPTTLLEWSKSAEQPR